MRRNDRRGDRKERKGKGDSKRGGERRRRKWRMRGNERRGDRRWVRPERRGEKGSERRGGKK